MREGLKNFSLRVAGTGFLGLAWLKHSTQGCRTPRPFSLEDSERCIDYDWSVVQGWLEALRTYGGHANPFRGRDVIELGPGSDLGVAGFLLALGAASYRAADANPLLAMPPEGFYSPLLQRIVALPDSPGAGLVEDELRKAHMGQGERIHWSFRPDFDLNAMLPAASADVIVSQAAFEHFDDVTRTLSQLFRAARPGAVLVAEVDLMTHSRWIRDRDPLNIYRHSDRVYRFFKFRGIPNRLRPKDYGAALRATGRADIRIQRKEELTAARFDVLRQGPVGAVAP